MPQIPNGFLYRLIGLNMNQYISMKFVINFLLAIFSLEGKAKHASEAGLEFLRRQFIFRPFILNAPDY